MTATAVTQDAGLADVLSTVFFVLQFQQDLADERSNEIRALTAYLQALIQLEEAKNTLLRSYNITVSPDGPRLQ